MNTPNSFQLPADRSQRMSLLINRLQFFADASSGADVETHSAAVKIACMQSSLATEHEVEQAAINMFRSLSTNKQTVIIMESARILSFMGMNIVEEIRKLGYHCWLTTIGTRSTFSDVLPVDKALLEKCHLSILSSQNRCI